MARLHRPRFPDPNVPPPGESAVTYGTGLIVTDGPTLEVDFGTEHDQVARGDATGSSTVLPENIVGITESGTAVLTGTAAEGRAALLERTVYDFASSTGWTVEAGTAGGSAEIADGVARMSLPASTTADWYGAVSHKTAPRIHRAIPSGDVSVRVRVKTLTGSNGYTRAALFFDKAATPARTAQVMVDSAGVVYSQSDSATNIANTSGTFALTIDDTAWMRLDMRAGRIVMYCGQSADDQEPDEWALVGEGPVNFGAVPYDRMDFVVAHYDSLASGPLFEVSRVVVRSLS